MILFLLWMFLSIIAGCIASDKGRSGIGFFFLSLILSPVVGIIMALIVQPGEKLRENQKIQSGQYKKCTFCAELIKTEAKVCRYCGRDLPKKEEKELGGSTITSPAKGSYTITNVESGMITGPGKEITEYHI